MFEAANGGTAFLDEVGELSLSAQAKLLRAIETGTIRRLGATKDIKVSTRIVAATNRPLEELVAAGTFREDLYFRLVGAVVHLPPLPDRPRDLVALTRRFLAEASAGRGHGTSRVTPTRIGPEVWAVLLRHRWPGSIRELRHVIEYAATAATGDVVVMMDLPPRLREALAKTTGIAPSTSPPTGFKPLADEVRELEERRMREALAATDGNRSEAARLLDMPRRTFMTRMKTFGIS